MVAVSVRDGYSSKAVHAIAAAAGVSAGTIYKSFGGKAGPELYELLVLLGGGGRPSATASPSRRDDQRPAVTTLAARRAGRM